LRLRTRAAADARARWGFAEAVRAGTGYVMCSYNDINGTHACANAYTQNNLLKGELGFAGAVMSDWGGTHADTDINGGLDISMPGVGFAQVMGTFWGSNLLPLVQNGTVAESRVDDAVRAVPQDSSSR
jgi:beta-glucosidase